MSKEPICRNPSQGHNRQENTERERLMSDETPWTKDSWVARELGNGTWIVRYSRTNEIIVEGCSGPVAKLVAAAPAMAELLEVIADAANDTLEDDGPNGFAEETQKRARALLTQINGTETK